MVINAELAEVTLDGVDVTDLVDIGDAFTVDIALDQSTNAITYAMTGELIMIGKAYDILRRTFTPSGCWDCQAIMPIKIRPACCQVSFSLIANAESVSFDTSLCEAHVTALTDNSINRAYNYLSSNVWWLNGLNNRRIWEDKSVAHLIYIMEPGPLGRIGVFGLPFFTPNYGLSGNQNLHAAPRLIDIFEWNTSIAGVNFFSDSIFSKYESYKRAAIIPPANFPGYIATGASGQIVEGNFPIETTVQLLQSLNPVFNADFRFVNGALRFETLEWWDQHVEIIDDLDQIISADRIEKAPLAQLDTEKNHAYGRFGYSTDSIDHVCNAQLPFYNDIIEWNPGGENRCLKGEKTNTIEYGCTHVVLDEGFVEKRETGSNYLILVQVNTSNGTMYMQEGLSALPKLVMLPQNWRDEVNKTRVETIQFGGPGDPIHLETGRELSFREDFQEGLYQRFHLYSAPGQGCNYVLLGDIEWLPEDFCGTVNKIIESGLNVALQTEWGPARAQDGISIDFSSQTITLRDASARCCPK